ncbi:MAG: hypothetical protein IRZ16_06115 [Myxococcaceae bacterium]|nr:hypothetical protein [Myxococcaceae bacterium]
MSAAAAGQRPGKSIQSRGCAPQLALLSGCGTAFLYDLENGKRSVRLDKLVDVLQVLGLELQLRPGKAGLTVEPLPT